MFNFRDSGFVKGLLGFLVMTAALFALPFSANAQIDKVLDHFRCYKAEGPPVNQFAVLRDQFDQLDQQIDFAIIFRAFRFCNPVEKTVETGEVTPMVDRRHHLTFYTMLDFPSGADRDIIAVNQFGEQRVNVLRFALLLGVPTDKNSEGFPEDLDHFKCYPARGEPVNRSVRLRDQFFPDSVAAEVLDPFMFCNPTLKFHAGTLAQIKNPDAHLLCYNTTGTDYEDLITARNQFEASELRIGGSNLLCVPTRKVLNQRLPDLVVRLPNRARVSCPGGGGTCTQEMDYEVREINGVAVGGNFRVEITNELGQSATAIIPGIGANGSVPGTVILGPPGDNCYNPDCTTRAVVDPPIPGAIVEDREDNNTDSRTDMG